MVPVIAEKWNCTPTPLHAENKDRNYELQKFGDYIGWNGTEQIRWEFKCEHRWTGNLFVELWSNRAESRLGWFHTTQTDWLLYGFHDRNVVYQIPWRAFRRFLWTPPDYRIDKCRFIFQSKYEQQNDTWGALVPVSLLKENDCVKQELMWY